MMSSSRMNDNNENDDTLAVAKYLAPTKIQNKDNNILL